MLVNWLKKRELRQSRRTDLNCEDIIKFCFQFEKTVTKQNLSVFFPALGSIEDVVVLGYTFCGKFLMTLNGQFIQLHTLKLSRRGIWVAHQEQIMTTRSEKELMENECVLLEVLYLKVSPKSFLVSLTIAVSEIDPNDRVSTGQLKIFYNGSTIYSAADLSLCARNNVMHRLSADGGDDAIVLLNSGTSLLVYILMFETDSTLSDWVTRADHVCTNLSADLGLEFFQPPESSSSTSAKSHSWYQNDFNGTKGSRTDCASPSVYHCAFDLEVFVAHALHRHHMSARAGAAGRSDFVAGSVFEIEHRVVGPCDSRQESRALEVLVIVGATYTHASLGQRSLSLLCAVSPFTGAIAVLKVCDLAQLCKSENMRFEAFRKTCAASSGIASEPWLSAAVSFYCAIVKTAYSPLLRGRRAATIRDSLVRFVNSYGLESNTYNKLSGKVLSKINSIANQQHQQQQHEGEEEEEFGVLTTWDMITHGKSLAVLTHPLVPVQVCLDEEQGEEDWD